MHCNDNMRRKTIDTQNSLCKVKLLCYWISELRTTSEGAKHVLTVTKSNSCPRSYPFSVRGFCCQAWPCQFKPEVLAPISTAVRCLRARTPTPTPKAALTLSSPAASETPDVSSSP